MLKLLLKWMNPWKYGFVAIVIASLLSWHYGGIYFAKQKGKQEQKQETVAAINNLIKKQEKQNETDNADVDATDVDVIRAGLLKQSRPSSSTLSASSSAYSLQYRSSSSDGQQGTERHGKAAQSMEKSYQNLCRQAGCYQGCRSIKFDQEFGIISDCK